MVVTLDDYMNNSAKNTRNNSIQTLDDFMNNRTAQSNSVTPRVTSKTKYPQTVQAPVNNNVSIGEGLGNIATAIGQGVGSFAQTVANDPLGFAGDTINSLVVQPVKEFGSNVLNPNATKSPWLAMGGGAVKGAVELPQNLWNLGVDAVNAYNNTPEQNQYKANYVENIANALQGNQLYQDLYQKPRQANQSIAELSSFAAPIGIVGRTGDFVKSINTANKVSKESSRIASKLSDAQRAKYTNQIQKLAKKNVANGTIRTSANDIVGNMATGFGLGALEGDTLQDRIANGTGMAALGLALTGGHAAAQKAWNSKRALELRKNSAETLNNLTNEYDSVSRAVAGIDNALNTNLSNNASDLTKLRKEYGELRAKNQNYKRNISDEEKTLLDDAGKLSDEQQTEIFERNKYGSRERALRISKDVKAELAKQNDIEKVQQEVKPDTQKEAEIASEKIKQEPKTTVKSQEEADKWFKDREEFAKKLEESKKAWEEQQEQPNQENEKVNSSTDDLSHVKSETDINTPEDIKTPQNEPLIRPQNERTVDKNGRVTVYNPDGTIKVRFKRNTIKEADTNKPREILDSERAEGSDNSVWYEQKTKGEFGTNSLDRENALTNDYLDEGKRLGMHEEDGISDIDALENSLHYKEKVEKENGSKKYNDTFTKSPGGARKYQSPEDLAFSNKYKTNQSHFVDDTGKNPTKKLVNFANGISDSMPDIVGKTIPFKAIRNALEGKNDKLFKSLTSRFGMKPYKIVKGEANSLEEAFVNKGKYIEVKSNIRTANSDNAKVIAEAIKQGRNVNAESVNGIEANTSDVIQSSKVYSKNSKIGNLARTLINDTKTTFSKLGDSVAGFYDKATNSIKLNAKRMSVFTHDHEVAHVIFNKYLDNLANEELIKKNAFDIMDIQDAINECVRIVRENKELFDEIDEYKKHKNTPNANAQDLKNVLSPEEYEIYKAYDKEYYKYKNSMNEQFADCVARSIFDGTPDEFIELYDRIKPEFDERVAKGEIYGTDTELRQVIENEQRRTKGNSSNAEHRGSERTYKENERVYKQSRSERSNGQSEQNSNRRTSGLDERYDTHGNLKRRIRFTKHGAEFFDLNKNNIGKALDWFDKTKNNNTKFYHEFLEATPEIKRFTDAFKTINDKREAFFREFGTYTDERMKARLFKQSKSGEGVYFQQGTKRNPKVEWGKESNDKVGFTGKKELEGISERGTTQEGLARGFSDIVRMEHTRNCINFLKENFSKPQEGFIPVNSKLLANAMYFGKSKAWYETIRKGQEAIEKTFDEKNAEEWNELYKTTEADKSDVYIPKDLLDMSITGEKELPLDYLATYGKMRGTKGKVKGMAKVAGAMLDFYTDRFKRKVLTSASFFTNNRFGNQIMLAMTADKPQDYIKGIADAFKLKESEVPTEILESTLAEAIQQEANTGIRKYFSGKNNIFDNIARVLDGDYSDLSNISGGWKLLAKAGNIGVSFPNRIFRSLSKLTGEINERFERFERKQAYSQALTKMQREKVLKTAKQFAGIHELAEVAKKDTLIREAVIDKVADVLGDYNNFSKFEKNVLKKIIPFYAWNRTITRHIISLTKDNPVKATLVAFETYRLLNQDDGLEDYQHGSIKTGWHNNRTEGNVVINKASMIPYNTLFDMVSGENIGSFSPAIIKPLEAARGEKFFKPASEITSKNWKRTTQDKKSGYVNTKTGEFRKGKAPASVRAGYLTKDAMETVYPMAGSPMTKGIPDAIKHYNKTGELLFPDKQYDANLGGFYDGDKAGKYKRGKKTYDRKLSAKNRLDLKYQLMNRTLGLGIQPEHSVSKERKEKYQQQRKRMRGY